MTERESRSVDRSKSRGRASRPVVERLDDRTLLSVGLDPGFGKAGQVIGTFGSTDGSAKADAVAVQPDGKIVVVGTVGGNSNEELVVERFDADGSVDPTFGVSGTAVAPITGSQLDEESVVNQVLIQPDGKIIVATPSAVFRLDSNGSVDTSFGAAGVFPETDATIAGLALQPDGKIVLAGSSNVDNGAYTTEFAALRLDADGTLDTTFGSGGLVNIPSPLTPGNPANFMAGPGAEAQAVAVRSDGKIILGGETSPYAIGTMANENEGIVLCLNTTGQIDTTFGTNGYAHVAGDNAKSVAIQSDGKIDAIGFSYNGSGFFVDSTQQVTRLNTDGTVDPTYNGVIISYAGIPTQDPNSFLGDVSDTLAIEPDGKVVTSGGYGTVARLNLQGNPDTSLAPSGIDQALTAYPFLTPADALTSTLAIGSDGRIVVLVNGTAAQGGTTGFLLSVLNPGETPGDYFQTGTTDPAIELPGPGVIAIRPSLGGSDSIIPFGIAGTGQTLPAPGDYDGSGRTELGVYLPSVGAYAYRPADGGPDQIIPFGIAGAGQSIPVPGNYDGSAQTESAVYLPSIGAFAYRPANGGADVIVPFGFAGQGQTIPAPADYFGTGQDDIAAYLPSLGAFAIRNPAGGPDEIIPFGIAGAGQSIPVPGDYDGSGKAEIAVYLPSLGEFAYRPANGGPDVIVPFGLAGIGQSIPMPGDYDGSGRTELGVYLPSLGLFAYRPANGGPDILESFGISGIGQSIPYTSGAASVASSTVAAPSVSAEDITAEFLVPLDAGALALEPGAHHKANGTT